MKEIIIVLFPVVVLIFVIIGLKMKSKNSVKLKRMKIGTTKFFKNMYQIRRKGNNLVIVSPVPLDFYEDEKVANLISIRPDYYAANMFCEFNAIIYKPRFMELKSGGFNKVTKDNYMVLFKTEEEANKALDWLIAIAVEKKLIEG